MSDRPPSKRHPFPRWIALAIAAFALAVLAAEWLGPRLVAAAYRQESLEIFNRLLAGRDAHGLEVYLDAWSVWSRRGLAALAVAGVAAGLLVRFRRRWVRAVREFIESAPRLTPVACLAVAIWFGALGGLAEAGHRGIRQWIEREPADKFGFDLLWLAPVASSLTFAVVALGLLAIARPVTPRRMTGVPMRPAVFLFAFLAAFGVFASPEFRLAPYAALLLSAGLAATVTRVAGTRHTGFWRTVRVTAPVLAVGVAGLMAFGLVTRSTAIEHRLLAGLPASAPDSPNVLLIILDTVRAADISLYGYERTTAPNLAELAEGGVVFDRAIATAPWTLTSHASMFTGRLPNETSAGFRTALDEAHPTVAEALHHRGYATAAFSANQAYASRMSGLDRGFLRYEDYLLSPGRFLLSAWLPRSIVTKLPVSIRLRWGLVKTTAPRVTGDFIRWLRRRGDRPFFAFLNYMDAHAPYLPPEPYRSRFLDPSMDTRRRKHEGNTVQEMRGPRALYDGAIAQLDRELARIEDALGALGLTDRTIIIVSSDHGELFGEHGLIDHANSMYLPLLRVPLVIRYPGSIPADVRVARAVSLRDLPATVLDLVGADAPVPFPGRSLRALWEEPSTEWGPAFSQLDVLPDARPWEPIALGPMSSVVFEDLHLIVDGAGGVELYDLARDPGEKTDLSDAPALAGCADALRALVDSVAAHGSAPAGSDEPPPLLPAACRREAGA